MRSPAEMQTIQIEITNFCQFKCSNCTRFCQHHTKPFFMTTEEFRAAIDSLVGYSEAPHAIVGFMGGSPEWHPDFEAFCDYALSKIPRSKLGLWGTFPPQKKHLREVICRTFGNILLNDHSRGDILHAPVLMGSEEYFTETCPECKGIGVSTDKPELEMHSIQCPTCNGTGKVTNEADLFLATERCWIQESWSASINPKGAWFCEVAAALSDLFDGPQGWEVKPGWWKKTPMDFKEQRDWACRKCGAALPIARIRNSQDVRDDISPKNLERLQAIKSKKVAKGEYVVHEEFHFDQQLTVNHGYPTQSYKDAEYRQGIAARYGIWLKLNSAGYWDPQLCEGGPDTWEPKPSLFKILQQEYTGQEIRS